MEVTCPVSLIQCVLLSEVPVVHVLEAVVTTTHPSLNSRISVVLYVDSESSALYTNIHLHIHNI